MLYTLFSIKFFNLFISQLVPSFTTHKPGFPPVRRNWLCVTQLRPIGKTGAWQLTLCEWAPVSRHHGTFDALVTDLQLLIYIFFLFLFLSFNLFVRKRNCPRSNYYLVYRIHVLCTEYAPHRRW